MARGRGFRRPRWMRSLPKPTLRGRIVLTFLVLGWILAQLLGNNPFIFFSSVLLATLLMSILATWLALPDLLIEREAPARVFAGEPFKVRLQASNRSRRRPAIGLGFRDVLQVCEQGESTRGPLLEVLPPGRTAEITYEKRIHRRGIYDLRATLAATRFPFGLFERRALFACRSRLVVLPARGRLRREGLRVLSRKILTPVAVRSRREGEEEFHSLREFLQGDNPRHIHWKTSARAGTLMRRVMRREAAEELTVLLDTYAEGLLAAIRRRNLEVAISCAATLLVHAMRQGRRARVLFPGGSATQAGGRRGLPDSLETLAGLRPGRVGCSTLVRGAPLRRGGAVVLLSLAGPARAARKAAALRGIPLRVWDLADPAFRRYFVRR